MTSAIREISIQRGHDPRDFTLIAFGGAGPMHALALAEEIGIPRVLVPRHPGNFSALGLLASDIKHDDVRTRVGPLRERRLLRGALFAEMERRGAAPARAGRLRAPSSSGSCRSLDLRYRGQAFELNVAVGAPTRRWRSTRIEADVPPPAHGAVRPREPRGRDRAGERPAHRLRPGPEAGRRARTAAARRVDRRRSVERAARLVRRARAHDCPVWERERLPERAELRGPAIVEEFGATTGRAAGLAAARVDEHGNLALRARGPWR